MNTTTGRRLLSLVLALVLALSLCVPAFADGETADPAGPGTVTEDASGAAEDTDKDTGKDADQDADQDTGKDDETKKGDAQIEKIIQDTLKGVREKLPDPGYGYEWYIIDMARSGYLEKGDPYFYVYYQDLCRKNGSFAKALEKAQKNGSPAGTLHSNKSTENSRVILALTAIGRDPGDVGGVDLLKPYTSENFSWITGQGLNAAIWALLALDSNDYPTEDDFRQRCVSFILQDGFRTADGGWDLAAAGKDGGKKEKGDPDVTAMALQALARYKEQPAVAAAIEEGLQVLSALQMTDGGYASYGYANSESISQVITACSILGVDVRTDKRFVKDGGKTPIDALLTYYDSDEKIFRHTNEKDVQADADMPIQQAVYALAAYQRLLSGKSSLYDMRDVSADCADGQHTFGEWKETAATCTEAGFKSRVCEACGRSEVVETAAALGHKMGTGYEMSDTAHWFPCTVCGAHLEETNHRYGGDQCTVCGYHKQGGRIDITTLTAVPDALKGVSGLDSVDKLKAKLLESAQKVDKNIKAENTRLLDVTLMIPSVENGKTVWSPATKSAFPDDGRITVLLPYPTGTAMTGYEFVVVHMFTTGDFGKQAGGMESPKVTKTADGLLVTTTGLSPVLIGWKTGTDTVLDKVVKSVRTGDSSPLALWACGVAVPAAALAVLARKRKRGAE